MKLMQAVKRALVSAAVVTLVAACGGGSDDQPAAPGTPDPVAGTSVGVLTDSPIGGVEYLTSSGYAGLTDAEGQYNYNPGETVEFRVGGISLGTVPATATVTPLELAGDGPDAQNKVLNLLVLLQSLDADGDPSNGITISEAARTAAASASIDLAADPEIFAGSSTLTTLLANAGVDSTPVPADVAMSHFRTQFLSQLAGGWVRATDTHLMIFRFAADGSYVFGENANAVGDGHSGVEQGTIDWNPLDGTISLVGTPAVDTNGDWGLSSLIGGEVLRIDGDKLVFTDPDGTVTTFSRIPTSDTNPLVGMWTLGSADDVTRQTFVFFASGRYMMLDPVGDEESPSCGGPGIERGLFTLDTATGAFAVTGGGIDTNGCAGLRDGEDNASFTMPVDQMASGAFTLDADGDSVTFTRVTP